jgi:hypothetical protein
VITKRSYPALAARAVAILVALVVVAAPAAAASAESVDSNDIYSGLNSARAAAGKGALAHNASLDAVALGWANQMAADNAMSHNPNTGSQIPAGWSSWGENVAHGFATGAATNVGWTNSPSHYANMIGDFTDIGIAFVSAGGTTWAVEVFGKYATTAASVSTQVVTAEPDSAGAAAPASEQAPVTAPVAAAEASTASTAGPRDSAVGGVDPEASATDELATDSLATDASETTTPAAASSRTAATQPIASVGLVAVAVAIALIVFLAVRARRKRVVDGEAAR